jgi:hypothetical protein
MQPTTKGLTSMFFATAYPIAHAGSLLPISLELAEALFLVLPGLRREDPALARPLRRAAVAVTHALVSARLATGKAQARRHLQRAHGQATEAHRLLRDAEARRYFLPLPGNGARALALADLLVALLAPAV